MENDDAQRHMHLRRGETDAASIRHGFHHIVDQGVDGGRGRVCHRLGGRAEGWIAPAGDFEDSHGRNMRAQPARVKGAQANERLVLEEIKDFQAIPRPQTRRLWPSQAPVEVLQARVMAEA